MRSLLCLLLLLASGCGLRAELAGDRKLAEEVGFFGYIRNNRLRAKISNPQGIASVTIKIRMWKDSLLLVDAQPVTVPVVTASAEVDRSLRRLIDETIPEGVTRVEIELISIERTTAPPPP